MEALEPLLAQLIASPDYSSHVLLAIRDAPAFFVPSARVLGAIQRALQKTDYEGKSGCDY